MRISPWIWATLPCFVEFAQRVFQFTSSLQPEWLEFIWIVSSMNKKWNNMKRKKVFLLVFLCVSGSLTLVQAFFDGSCPKHATFFEASNTTTDCNGAMPISTFGIKGDKFCSNICPDVSNALYFFYSFFIKVKWRTVAHLSFSSTPSSFRLFTKGKFYVYWL